LAAGNGNKSLKQPRLTLDSFKCFRRWLWRRRKKNKGVVGGVKKKKKQTAHSPTTFHQFFLFILSLVSSNLLLPYRKPVERSTVSSFSLSIRVVLYIDGLVLSIYTGSVPLPPHLHWYDTVV
jgi:hypothetical protein